MDVLTYSHLAIGVREMDRSLAFYRDVIGLEPVFDDLEVFEGTSVGDIRRRGVYLRWDKDLRTPFLVLDQLLTGDREGDPKKINEIGVHHFGFWVEDVDAIVARAHDAGVKVVSPPKDLDTRTYGEPPGGTIRTALLFDPDGNAVQLDQRVS